MVLLTLPPSPIQTPEWILAQALAYFKNDLSQELLLFDKIRLPYYRKLYTHLEGVARFKKTNYRLLKIPVRKVEYESK